jgi:cystathionine beta-lyase/cystathionine gamma-synthase
MKLPKKQMSGFGGMVSFDFVSGAKQDAITFEVTIVHTGIARRC